MPTRLRQNMQALQNKGMSCDDNAHCSLRHHHIAGVYRHGRRLSVGYNRKYCSLRGGQRHNQDTNRTRRGRCYQPRPDPSSPPIAHILPYRYPTTYKIKQLGHVTSMRQLYGAYTRGRNTSHILVRCKRYSVPTKTLSNI